MRSIAFVIVLVAGCDKPTPSMTPPPIVNTGRPLDPVSNVRLVEEMERRCRANVPGTAGQACLIAATAYELGDNGVVKDVPKAAALYGTACTNKAITLGHDVAFYCAAAQRLKGDGG